MSAEAPDPIGGGGFRYQSSHAPSHNHAVTGTDGLTCRAHVPAHLPATGFPSGMTRRTRPRLTSVSSGDGVTS